MAGCWICALATSARGTERESKRGEQCRTSASGLRLRLPLRLSFLACVAGRAEATKCKLSALMLRHRDDPIDLVPPFVPSTYMYEATMDFAMETFSVDVRASDNCEVDEAPNSAIDLRRGGVTQLSVFARDPKTQDRQPYQLKVRRLKGSETEVNSLRIEGAELKPVFRGEVRDYKAFLQLNHDIVTLSYVVQDNGQHIRCTAEEQSLPASEAAISRRLQTASSSSVQPVGEVQYRERRQSFPIDVSHLRKVTITVESADPMQAHTSGYTVTVMREGCPEARPLYDPFSQACVVNCPSAFYPNPEAGRCSKCNTHCAVCLSILHCQLCQEDTVEARYVAQPDGSCLEVPEPILTHYWWWCIGLGIFLVLLFCMGWVLLCQCLCDACCRRRPAYDSDSSDDGMEAEFGYGKRGW